MRCSKCGKDGLTERDFHKDKKSSSGLRSECKQCHQKQARTYRLGYYRKNMEAVKKYAKERYAESVFRL